MNLFIKIRMFFYRLIPESIKKSLRIIYYYFQYKIKTLFRKNIAFLVLTPQHDNYGDHAIALSEIQLLSKQKYHVVEITGKKLSVFLHYPNLIIKIIKKHPIFINGGGNLGTLWFDDAEMLMRQIITLFPNNTKVIFPQTVYYEDSAFGREQLQKSIEIYNTDNLVIMAREKASYEYLKRFYKCKIYLIPDMVLFLNLSMPIYNREGVMLLFRSDREKTMEANVCNKIVEFLKTKFAEIEFSDMASSENILPQKRQKELDKKFCQFCSKKLVVTDRLHGMIFSAITGTPCIVFNSLSPKVKGVYDWIFKDCPYICFMQNLDIKKMDLFINSVCDRAFTYDNSALKPYYHQLEQLVNGVESIG